MALTKVTNSMIVGAPVNVLDFGAVGDGRTDNSAAFQAAADAAIATTGEIFVPAGEYLIDDSVVLNFPGGVKIRGVSPNSIGTRSEILQKDINKPVFQIESIATHLTGLSFTCFAGSKVDANGNPITVVSATANSITLSANPWEGGSPIIWNLVTPAISTDGTPYASVIQFSVQGSWYASSVTVNGNGTVTLNNVKGANGTLNALISGTPGNAVEKFISLAMAIDPAGLTNPNAGMIYCSVKENQFYDTLWFNQVTRAFNFSALGSGGGVGVGTGNAGFMSNIVLDQGQHFIYGQGDIYGLQITNSQFYGVGVAFYAPFDSIKSSNFSNCQVFIGKMFQANLDLYGLTVTGCSFNAMDGYGYSNLLFNNGGVIDRCTFVGNNFGRATDVVINTTAINATIIAGNDIISNGELSGQPWLYVAGVGAAGYITNSYLGGNNFAGQYVSNANRLGFLSTSPRVTGSTFGSEWIGYQTGTKVIGWLAPTFQNSWANVGAGTQTVEYCKDQNGVVHIKGELVGGASGTVAFTLPAGYRPLAQLRVYSSRANTASGEVPMAVQIDTTGAVTIQTAVVAWGDFGMLSFPTR
jgi:hypothetical protein